MKLIVGLGNPGVAYAKTRHNIGFMVVDAFCEKNKLIFSKKARFKAYEATGNNLVILKPLTYMNLSGESVQSARNFYKLPLEELLVIIDDIALPFGEIRLRAAGSSGGHKGLKSIEHSLQSQSWARLRIGVGSPLLQQSLEDFVLEPFNAIEQEGLGPVITKAVEAIELWSNLGVSRAMTLVNKPS